MNDINKFLQIALPCLTFSPGLALDKRKPELVKEDIDVLVKGAKGTPGPRCEFLARKYFYYANWLQKRAGMKFGQRPLEYFLLQHNSSPSANLEALDDPNKSCQVRLVEVIDMKKRLARDLNSGKKLKFKLKFRPGEALLKNLEKLPHLVITSDKPEIHLLDNKKRKEIRNRLNKLNFEVGPWIDLDGKFYIMHWDVLCYKLQDSDLKKEIPLINFNR